IEIFQPGFKLHARIDIGRPRPERRAAPVALQSLDNRLNDGSARPVNQNGLFSGQLRGAVNDIAIGVDRLKKLSDGDFGDGRRDRIQRAVEGEHGRRAAAALAHDGFPKYKAAVRPQNSMDEISIGYISALAERFGFDFGVDIYEVIRAVLGRLAHKRLA